VEIIMGRKSAIVKLRPNLKAELDGMIAEGAATVDELTEWLGRVLPDDPPSRSAVGRYVRKQRVREEALDELSKFSSLAEGEGRSEALELIMELATLRLREVRVLDRMREIGVIG
jgi:hypothetical protein